jgi:hypothetical protein
VDDRSGGVLPNVPPDRSDPAERKENTMKGYLASDEAGTAQSSTKAATR